MHFFEPIERTRISLHNQLDATVALGLAIQGDKLARIFELAQTYDINSLMRTGELPLSHALRHMRPVSVRLLRGLGANPHKLDEKHIDKKHHITAHETLLSLNDSLKILMGSKMAELTSALNFSPTTTNLERLSA